MDLHNTTVEEFVKFFGQDIFDHIHDIPFNFRFGQIDPTASGGGGRVIAAVTPNCAITLRTGLQTIVVDPYAMEYVIKKFCKGDMTKHRQIARGALVHELTHVRQMNVGDLTEPDDPNIILGVWKGVAYRHPTNEFEYLSLPWERDAHIFGWMAEHCISEQSATKLFEDALWRTMPFKQKAKAFLKLIIISIRGK